MKLIVTTTKDMQEAKKIAKELVQNRLAACVNIVPKVTSLYIWEGEIVEDSEALLLIKALDFYKVKRAIKELHSYKVPEIIAFEVDEVSHEYLGWIQEVLLQ